MMEPLPADNSASSPVLGEDATFALARTFLARFPAMEAARLIALAQTENTVFRVETPGGMWALRLNRPHCHAQAEIRSELAWVGALHEARTVDVAPPVPGLDGDVLQSIETAGGIRHGSLFPWRPGSAPDETHLESLFEVLGATAARLHAHARIWVRPVDFVRPVWDMEHAFGARARWGSWRDGLGMDSASADLFARCLALMEMRLARFGKAGTRFGLVHGDMRSANLLVKPGGLVAGSAIGVTILDFDDSGFSWFLYDCAASLSFIEDRPDVPELIAAWVRGYRTVGVLGPREVAEIPTFVLFRRLLLVAWIGSHRETDLAKSLGPAFTRASVPLAQDWLDRMGANP